MQKRQPTSAQTHSAIADILEKIPDLNKCRRHFLQHLLVLLLCLPRRCNFRTMSLYGDYHERTYRRHFEAAFDWTAFNLALIQQYGSGHYVVAFDPTFVAKSGKKTPKRGNFWNGCASRNEKGLEFGGLAVIDLTYQTAFHLAAQQSTPAKQLAKDQSMVTQYADFVISNQEAIKKLSNIVVADAFFCKKSFLDPLTANGLQVITKGRKDMDLRYLYRGAKRAKGSGRQKIYDGKINTKNLMKHLKKDYFDILQDDEQQTIFCGEVNAKNFKRNIILVIIYDKKTGRYTLLVSTDLTLDGRLIISYYTARFQIEFLYRDAKQFCGFTHCQARSVNKLHFQANAALTAVSVAKMVHYIKPQQQQHKTNMSYSIADIKTLYFNELYCAYFFSNLQIPLKVEEKNTIKTIMLNFGRKAA
jgi:hypothetical protein